MKQKIALSFGLLAGLFSTAVAQKSFTKLKSGLEYKIIKDVPGDKKAVEGSMITMHIRTSLNDSTLFDSYKMNNNEPVPATISKPQANGDVMEGLTLLSAGDSAQFRTPVDSIFRNGQTIPPFAKSGDFVIFTVKMITVKTQKEAKEEQEKAAKEQIAIDDKLIQDYIIANQLKAIKTPSGLYYVITQKGSGANAVAGQKVTMNYTGKLTDGSVFDSNTDPKFSHVQPFEFALGSGQVIKGWDEGIALLNKGAKAILIIPSPLAYGNRSMPGNPNNPKGIPANSVLVFDVEMVDAK
ncbi:MAG: FKBP-type peptidyl-prolyl cis-trans isomerase [Chitinophagaceae bacterium]|nr:FKBP-type peptidyl-prolyl cis-trans isomerase [Chitinophagaceae bacterium]